MSPVTQALAQTLFDRHRQDIWRRTDRTFGGLLILQWIVLIAIAGWVAPYTWAGPDSWIHPHVLASLFLGGLIVAAPLVLIWLTPGRTLTRHVVSVAQMLLGSLLIHVMGGRIEAHFHVFGSLAFLAFYCDWKVLMTGTVVVAADHLLRGLWFPESVFGDANASKWRWLEHAAWVVFLDTFLLQACFFRIREMREIAQRQADLETTKADIELIVEERTAQLKDRERQQLSITQELRDREEMIRTTVTSAGDAIFTFDEAGKLESVNPAAERLFGYDAAELVGQNIQALLTTSPDGKPTLRSAIGIQREVTARRRDGSALPMELTVSTMQLQNRNMFTGIGRDITERKRIERELQKAKETAEAASKAKSEFLANMSHEIRTPMNGILGMTELALTTELAPDQREYLQVVKQSGENLLRILNDILDFSKIEAGKLDLESTPFELRATLGAALKTHAYRCHEKGLELIFHVHPDIPDALQSDPVRIQQILVNLVGNAVKFTEKGEVVVEVAAESLDSKKVGLHFSVSDTGIGIPKDKQDSIFQAFTQADGSTTRRYGGTGLGLSISAQLVAMLKGRIWIDSEPGKGSAFHFVIPCPLASPHQIRHAASLLTPTTLHKLRDLPVLIVDDNATNRRILVELTRLWHMSPVAVEGGAEALVALQQARDKKKPFRLVLLDAMMPEMDGFSLAEKLRDEPELSRPTVLMLSSANQTGDAIRCRDLGLAGYLVKPVQQTELLKAIVAALKFSTHDAPAPVLPAPTETPKASLRILLAEDNRINQKVAVGLLTRSGHRVEIANNGKEALERWERESFDLILMDVQMPEMNGFEATGLIRERERGTGQHMKIIAMTAHAMKGDRERCLAAGMDAYLSKPIKVSELDKTILELSAQVESSSAHDLFDFEKAVAALGGDEELLREVVTLFLQHGPQMLKELRAAVDEGKDVESQRKAHSLKGALLCLGADRVVSIAQAVENQAASGQWIALGESLSTLEEQMDRLVRILSNSV